jgi:glutathione S-transferase
MLTLYYAPGSSSLAVHIALNEVGATFETRALSLDTKDTQKPEFLKINPNGKVPTLLIDGRVLTEVAGCLFYLARAFPAAKLLPVNDPEAEAQVVSWMSFVASAIHPSRAAGIERVREVWQVAEKRLAGKEWAVGNAYSIADIHLFRLYWRMRGALELKPEDTPAVYALYERVLARPAVKKTLADEKVG